MLCEYEGKPQTLVRFVGTTIACPYRLKIGALLLFAHVRLPLLFR